MMEFALLDHPWFDSDADITQVFVDHHLNPNEENVNKIKNYYSNAMDEYWDYLVTHTLLPENLNKDQGYGQEGNIINYKQFWDYSEHMKVAREKIYNVVLDKETVNELYFNSVGFIGIDDMLQEIYPIEFKGVYKDRWYRNVQSVIFFGDVNGPTASKQKFIRDNISIYKEKFDKIKKRFMVAHRIRPIYVWSMVIFITNLLSFKIDNFDLANESKEDLFENFSLTRYIPKMEKQSYILMNGNGIHSFSTYLHCKFNGVNLYGLSKSPQDYDFAYIQKLPISLIGHDLAHESDYDRAISKSINFDSLKKIFYKVINSSYELLFKRFIVISIWFQLHEWNKNMYDFKTPEKILLNINNPFSDTSDRMYELILPYEILINSFPEAWSAYKPNDKDKKERQYLIKFLLTTIHFMQQI